MPSYKQELPAAQLKFKIILMLYITKYYLRTLHFRFKLWQICFLNHLSLHTTKKKNKPSQTTQNFTYLHNKHRFSPTTIHCKKKKTAGVQNKHTLTFCISPLETKVWATFSKLSFRTSVIAAVIASACFDGTPCASKPLTFIYKS